MSGKTKMLIIRRVLEVFTSSETPLDLTSKEDISDKMLPVLFEYGYTNIICCPNNITGVNDIITISKEDGDKDSEINITCEITDKAVLQSVRIAIEKESLTVEKYKDVLTNNENAYRCTETVEYATERNYLKRTLFTMSEDCQYMYALNMIEDLEYSAIMNAKLAGTFVAPVEVILPEVEIYKFQTDVEKDNVLNFTHIGVGHYSPMKRRIILHDYHVEPINNLDTISHMHDIYGWDIDSETLTRLVSKHCIVNREDKTKTPYNMSTLDTIKYDDDGNIISCLFAALTNKDTKSAIAYDSKKGGESIISVDKTKPVLELVKDLIKIRLEGNPIKMQDMYNATFGEDALQVGDVVTILPMATELLINALTDKDAVKTELPTSVTDIFYFVKDDKAFIKLKDKADEYAERFCLKLI